MADLDMRRLHGMASELVARIDDVVRNEPRWEDLGRLVGQSEALITEQVMAGTRWGELKRHLRFGEDVDWADIARSDWPSVRRRLTSPTTGA